MESSLAAVPSGRDSRVGWYDTHEIHVRLAGCSRPSVILIGDSIIAGLSRYPQVWNRFFKPWRALNFGIGGDRTQHVLWRATNIELPVTTNIAVVHCGCKNCLYDGDWMFIFRFTVVIFDESYEFLLEISCVLERN